MYFDYSDVLTLLKDRVPRFVTDRYALEIRS